MCPIEALEEEVEKRLFNGHLVLGRVSVDRSMCWTQLSAALSHTFTSHLQILCGEPQMAREEVQRSPLGLSSASIASVLIGEDTQLSGSFSVSVVPSFLHLSSSCFAFSPSCSFFEFLHVFPLTCLVPFLPSFPSCTRCPYAHPLIHIW